MVEINLDKEDSEIITIIDSIDSEIIIIETGLEIETDLIIDLIIGIGLIIETDIIIIEIDLGTLRDIGWWEDLEDFSIQLLKLISKRELIKLIMLCN